MLAWGLAHVGRGHRRILQQRLAARHLLEERDEVGEQNRLSAPDIEDLVSERRSTAAITPCATSPT
jgi:hypothetical protein